MQYFRVRPDQWEDRLQRLAALGVNTVDTYIAWNFHEGVEGERDLSGWRDIERYIRLAGGSGLDVLVRPSRRTSSTSPARRGSRRSSAPQFQQPAPCRHRREEGACIRWWSARRSKLSRRCRQTRCCMPRCQMPTSHRPRLSREWSRRHYGVGRTISAAAPQQRIER